jgi:large subunit ribosomal protein L25
VYYGPGLEPKNVEIPHAEFAAVVRARKHTHLFDLGLGSGSIAVIREVQRNKIKDSVYYNLDFMHIDMNKKTIVDVPVELIGVPAGVKDDGGVLGHPFKTVKVECLPTDIPEKITIDVAALKIGESVHVRDLSIPNVTFRHAPEEVLAVVTHPTREKAAVAAEEDAAAPAAGKTAAKPAAKSGK